MITLDDYNRLSSILSHAQVQDNLYVAEGSVPVLVSVPHAIAHMRDGMQKSGEVNTDVLGLILHEHAGCHLIMNAGVPGDPNHDESNIYKERLVEYVRTRGIVMVIDVHGASLDREFDFELGTGKGTNVERFPECVELFRTLPELDEMNVTVDKYFPACQDCRVSSFVSTYADVPCLQIEINRRRRDDYDSVRATSALLVRYVRGMASFLSLPSRENRVLLWTLKADAFMPRNLVMLPDGLNGALGINENVDISFGPVNEEFVVKGHGAPVGCMQITGQMVQRCGEQGYGILHVKEYASHKIAKPQAEDIDNVYALLSEDLCERYNDCEMLEVLNPVDNLRSYFKIRKYEGNVNGRTDTVWLSYYQRKLLGIEVPHTLSHDYMLKLLARMSEDDAAFFKAQYQYDGDHDSHVRVIGNADAGSRLTNIWTSIFGNVRFRGLSAKDADVKQNAVLERLVGKKPLQLRAVRCADTNEVMDAVFVTKNSSIVLGVSELDYVWIKHEGKKVRAKVVLIEQDDYPRIVKANGLKSDEELDMLVCIPAKIRLGLGIYEPGTSVQLERSVKDLFVKNTFAQMMTLLGLFIAVMSLPDIRMIHKMLIFVLLSPVIMYSVLAEERNKI